MIPWVLGPSIRLKNVKGSTLTSMVELALAALASDKGDDNVPMGFKEVTKLLENKQV